MKEFMITVLAVAVGVALYNIVAKKVFKTA
jgi:hypothetical protein